MNTPSISTQRPAVRASSVKAYLAPLCAMLATLLCAMSFVATAPAAAAKGLYKIETHTCGNWGAGTDANVRIMLYGTTGTSPWLLLDGPGNNHERWSTDKFSFYLDEVGTLKSVRLKRDDWGIHPNWCLNVVYVTATINNVTSSESFFPNPNPIWIPSGSLGTHLPANV